MRLLPALLLLLAAAASPAAADPLSAAADAASEVRLIPGWRQADGSRLAAVEIRLAPGWHTYWRVPGAAGIPTRLDWSGSENLAAVSYEWPHPAVFDSFGLTTIGYADTLVLPVRLTAREPQAPLALALVLHFGVCSDICVPADRTLTARLDPDAPEEGRALIEAALARRARTPGEAGVVSVSCSLARDADGYAVTAEIGFAAAPAPGQVAVIEAGQPDLWVGAADSRTEGRTVFARAPIETAGDGTLMLDRRSLRLTVLDAGRAVDIPGCKGPG